MKKTIFLSQAEFAALWNSSDSVEDFCVKSGLKITTARVYATKYRGIGSEIKYFPGHGAKKRLIRDGTPTCRYCSVVLTGENWYHWDRYQEKVHYCNYTCRPCQSEDRKRRQRMSSGATMNDATSPSGRKYPQAHKVDFGMSPRCHRCDVLLSSENWRRHAEWSMRVIRKTGYDFRCVSCKSSQTKDEWYWMKSRIHGANHTNSSRLAEGRLTFEGMRAKWTGKCHWCDKVLKTKWDKRGDPDSTTPDHKVPITLGGPNSDDNTVWSCWECNYAHGSVLPDTWMNSMVRILSKHRPIVAEPMDVSFSWAPDEELVAS